jgi:thiamine biosynthesis protein ThiS
LQTRHIRLNGERRELETLASVQALLDELGLDRERVAVEVNRRILKRTEFDAVTLDDGDEVEVVTFVGGG